MSVEETKMRGVKPEVMGAFLSKDYEPTIDVEGISVNIPFDIYTGVTFDEAKVLARLAHGKHVLELGAWQGFSTVVMAQTAALLVSVDTHRGVPSAGFGDTLHIYMDHLVRYGVRDRVITLVSRFDELLGMLLPGKFNFAFLDGAHDAESVMEDLSILSQLLSGSAVIACHDYKRQSWDEPYLYVGKPLPFEVEKAVDPWLHTHRAWRMESTVDSLAILKRD